MKFTDLTIYLNFDTDRTLPNELYIAPILNSFIVRGLLLKPEGRSENTFVRVGYFEVYRPIVQLDSVDLEIDSASLILQEIADESTWKIFHLV